MTSATIDAIRECLPRVRERAIGAERERRVPRESIDELRAAGMFRILQPAGAGGLEADPLQFFEAARLVATACGSTGWVASVLGVHPWQIALFEDRAQKEVWGNDPDTLVSSSYAPTGKVDVVDGGYRISGRWSFSSGCDHATWVLLGGVVIGPQGTLRSTSAPSSCLALTTASTTCGTRSGCAAPGATTSSSKVRSCRLTAC